MAIGGLKEKTMAALRHGVRTVIIPAENEKDLEEIDQTVRSRLNFITVREADAVIGAALDLTKLTGCKEQKAEDQEPLNLPVAETPPRKPGIRQ